MIYLLGRPPKRTGVRLRSGEWKQPTLGGDWVNRQYGLAPSYLLAMISIGLEVLTSGHAHFIAPVPTGKGILMGIAFGSLGSICFLIGWIWIVVLAFQNGDTVWGICSLLFCGIVSLIYGIMHFQQAKVPVILLVIGMLAGGTGRVMIQ